jgi:hypothetical protein
MDDAVGDGVTTQGDVNGGGFVGDRLQLGDGLGDGIGVIGIGSEQYLGFLRVRLPAILSTLTQSFILGCGLSRFF